MSERITQVLSLHRITPRCYDLTSVRTGSVRDQLIRATLLADALLRSGLVAVQRRDSDDEQKAIKRKRLLVLGAGVAGVALGLSAAEQGADVTIVEKETYPFGTLASCYWRTVDPTEYDWPHQHWNQGSLPIVLPGAPVATGPGGPQSPIQLPLPPSRLTGSRLAGVWSSLHSSALSPPVPDSTIAVGAGSLTILYGRNANDLTIDDSLAASALATRVPGHPMLTVSDAAATELVRVTSGWTTPSWNSEKFAAIVSCIGFGEEITSERPPPPTGQRGNWNGFTGHHFWQDYDGMKRSGFFKRTNRTMPTAILISGSGDGAMQDFQRAATGRFGRDLYEKIKSALPTGRFTPEGFMQDAILAEDYARRAHGWRPIGASIDATFQHWHDAYERAVNEVWSRWNSATKEHEAVAKAVLRPEVINELTGSPGPRVTVRWVIRESTPAYTYGLNRFLSLLVLRLMALLQGADHGRPHTLLTQHEIHAISPHPPHVCSGNPAGCYAIVHDVLLRNVVTHASVWNQFDLILIRHGQEASPLLGGASVPEQQVPFDIPR